MAANPRTYQFDLPIDRKPRNVIIPERWYPGIDATWSGCTSERTFDPIFGIRAVVVHATAGSSSAGAVSVMKAGKASFHWLVPDEDEPQHGHVVWACAPEARAAWHVRNDRSHPDVWEGRSRVNHYSLGIEVVNAQNGADPFSDWQVAVTAEIIRYCWEKYPNLRHVVSHAKLDPERRSDPGGLFPWERLKAATLRDDDALEAVVAAATPVTALAESDADPCAACVA
jgi:N-acetyl-anhydromuramyl-L-alanine amidase AmpD